MTTNDGIPAPETPPALADAEREQLARLAGLPDGSIDTSDIPELTEDAWSVGVRGRFHRSEEPQARERQVLLVGALSDEVIAEIEAAEYGRLRDEVVPVAAAMQADPTRAIPLDTVFDGLRALHAKRLGRYPPPNGSS